MDRELIRRCANYTDLEELPPGDGTALSIHLVEQVEDVFKLGLVEPTKKLATTKIPPLDREGASHLSTPPS
jgi:hypothetical protein